MKKVMLINVLQPEECRIAILENGILEELYVERNTHESYVGNIYKGKIVNIEPSIQAAFVDFGIGRNGFLHVSDVEPTYYKHLDGFKEDNEDEEREDRRPRRGSSNGGGSNNEEREDRRPRRGSSNSGGSNDGSGRGARSKPFEKGNIPDVENLPLEEQLPVSNAPEFGGELFEEQDDLAFENRSDFVDHDSDSSISSNSDDSVTFGAGLSDDEDDFGPDDNDTPPVMPSANRITSDGDSDSDGPGETENDDLLFSRPARSNPPAHKSSPDKSDSFDEPVFQQNHQPLTPNDNFDDDVEADTQDADQSFDADENVEQDDDNQDEDGQDPQSRDSRGQRDSRGPQRDQRGGDNRSRGGSRGGNQRRPSGGGYSSGSREGARDQGRSSGNRCEVTPEVEGFWVIPNL